MTDTKLSATSIKPLAGYVFIEPTQAQRQTATGIYLPTSTEERPQTGTVIAVGDAVMIEGKEVASPVKKGDVVIYKKWGGNEVKIGDVEYQLMKFEDVMAKVGK